MTISGYDAILKAASQDKTFQPLHFNKFPLVTMVNGCATFWQGSGNPGPGAVTAVGKANGAVCTSATAGAIPFSNAPIGKTNHITAFGLFGVTASPLGYAVLVDRLAHVRLDANESSGNIVGMDATAGLRAITGAGEGAQLWAEITDAALTGGVDYQFQLGYTNERGTTGHALASSLSFGVSTLNRNPLNSQNPFTGTLLAGDVGIRSIQSITRFGGTTVGAWNLVLVKPIAWLAFLPSQQIAQHDYIYEFPRPSKIRDNACLQVITNCSPTISIAGVVHLVAVG